MCSRQRVRRCLRVPDVVPPEYMTFMFYNPRQLVIMEHALPSAIMLKDAHIYFSNPPVDLSVLAPIADSDRELYAQANKRFVQLSQYYEDVRYEKDYEPIVPQDAFPRRRPLQNSLGCALRTRLTNLANSWNSIAAKVSMYIIWFSVVLSTS